jgi:ribosomal protein S27E
MTETEEVRASFRIICRKCQSEDVVLDVVPLREFGGETGGDGGFFTIGCNACKQNDVILYPI